MLGTVLALPLLLATPVVTLAAPAAAVTAVGAGVSTARPAPEAPEPPALETLRFAPAPAPRRAVWAVSPASGCVIGPALSGRRVSVRGRREPNPEVSRPGVPRAPPGRPRQPA